MITIIFLIHDDCNKKYNMSYCNYIDNIKKSITSLDTNNLLEIDVVFYSELKSIRSNLLKKQYNYVNIFGKTDVLLNNLFDYYHIINIFNDIPYKVKCLLLEIYSNNTIETNNCLNLIKFKSLTFNKKYYYFYINFYKNIIQNKTVLRSFKIASMELLLHGGILESLPVHQEYDHVTTNTHANISKDVSI